MSTAPVPADAPDVDDHHAPVAGDAEIAARIRLGRALRALGHHVVGHHTTVHDLDRLAAHLEAVAADLPVTGVRSRPVASFGPTATAPAAEGDVLTSFIDRPFCGEASPWSLDPIVRRVGDEIVATFTLHAAHEGAPGRSHGGVVAGLFDDILGFVLNILEVMAFTGQLTVRYEAGVPIHRELTMRARFLRREGRKIFVSADAWDGDERLATAEAIFVAVEGWGRPA
jgi:acyl-coenzyme A thioesterase PaaI-like protein